MTPEGKVKDKVKIILKEFHVYWFMPVQMGYGAAGVDFHCVLPGGLAFFIETKRPDKEDVTYRQGVLLEHWDSMGIQTFVINDDSGCSKLRMWLEANALVSLRIPMVRIR